MISLFGIKSSNANIKVAYDYSFKDLDGQELKLSEFKEKVVVVTNGRYAGKKAVIVKCNDEGTNARPYGHALVCGLRTVPRKITRKMDQKKQDKRSRCKTFIKYINLNHLMPTRYSLDVDLKGVVTPDVLDDATKKVAAQKESKKLFEEKFKTGKNRWFFTRLAF